MVAKTSGGLIKSSTAWDEEALANLDRLAEERGGGTTRSDVIREAVRLGMPLYEQQTAMLRSLERASAQAAKVGAA